MQISNWDSQQPGTTASRRLQLPLAGVLLACGLTLMACSSDNSEQAGGQRRPDMAMRGGMTSEAAIPVQVAEVRRGDISIFLQHTTTIEAAKTVDVVAKVTGQVVQLPAEEGRNVRRGALLAQLDEAELKIDLIQAEAKLKTDESAYERAKSMLEKNLIAKENYDVVRLQYENSKAAYEAAKLRIEYTSIRSPIDGVVTLRHIELGQRINTNQVLFTIADFEPLRARIFVPEKDMRRLFEGQVARIQADALPNTSFKGVVKIISPVVDPTSGTVRVTIDIPDANGGLRPGMFATVYITTETHTNTLLIPKRAILLESDTDQVFRFVDGRARKAMVQIGFSSGDTVEILSGLNEGDLVVTVGQDGLREGLPIRVPGRDIQVTEAAPAQTQEGPANGASEGQQERRPRGGEGNAAAQRQAPPAAAATPAGAAAVESKKVDEAMVKRIEERLLQNPRTKGTFDERVAQDPDFANNPAKKLAFFEEMVDRWANFMMNRPEIAEAWEKRVAADPDFENNIEKKVEFFSEMFQRMRGGGRR